MSATRSRRSGAGESGSLNAATIPLLPTARLKSELEARGTFYILEMNATIYG